jgi:signal transduction histidine kinase
LAISEILFSRISASTSARFGVALFATLLALLSVRATDAFAAGASPYLAALVAVSFCAWFCGTAPAVVSMALSLLTIDYWFIPPIHSLRVMQTVDRTNFIVFLIAAVVIATIGEASLRERGRLAVASQALEEKVRARTGELDHANHSLRQLTSRLLNLQDEERRRIARELHDNAGQALSALAMNLSAVADDLGRLMKTAETVADSAGMVRHMSDDIRTMSYLLHPPLLDEMGLAPALRWFVEGFAERSKIEVKLQCDRNIRRLPREVETAIFRIVQECLTNIHRHSGSSTAAIQVNSSDHDVTVEVWDDGKGISPRMRDQMESGGTLGVGVRGMRERARQLGGSLEISSDGEGTGTRIVVRLPATELNQDATRAARAGSFEG